MAWLQPGLVSGSAGTCTALLQALHSSCCQTASSCEQVAAAGLCDLAVERLESPRWGWCPCVTGEAALHGRLELDASPSSWGHSPPSPTAQASHRIYLSLYHF